MLQQVNKFHPVLSTGSIRIRQDCCLYCKLILSVIGLLQPEAGRAHCDSSVNRLRT